MWHWRVSSAAGFVIAGQYRPICSLSQSLPDCAPRRAFERAMERAFGEARHVQRVHATWLIGNTLRGDIQKEISLRS